MDINQVLQYLVYGGGSVALVSFVAERLSWYQAQTAPAKQWLAFGTSSLIALGAYAVITYVPTTVLTALNPWFLIESGIFSVYFLGQAFHSQDKLPSARQWA